jgi:predicted dehydrogenase
MDKWWVPGLNIGYEHSFINQFADFVDGFGSRKKRPNRPDFRDALETQYICEAVLDSAKTGRWKKVGKIKAK